MIKVYAEDSLLNLFEMINRWNRDKLLGVYISLQDLTLMKNHIEDLELSDTDELRDYVETLEYENKQIAELLKGLGHTYQLQ